MIKIISGTFSGTNLHVPGIQTRPTTNRVRKVIFDVLQDKVCGANVLDAFAGTGACGIEAISMGATHVTFVEKSRESFKVLQKNITKLKILDNSTCVNEDFFRLKLDKNFDLILLDPPYSAYQQSRVIKASLNLAKPGAIIVYESDSQLICDLAPWKTKTIGVVKLHFFVV